MAITDEMWGILIGHLASIEANTGAGIQHIRDIDTNMERIVELLEKMNQKLANLRS